MTPHQRKLAKAKARDEKFARDFGRTSKYAETLTEGHDSGAQGYQNREQERGNKTAFRQIAGPDGVIGVTG